MCKHSLIDLLNLSHANSQRFLLMSSFDIIDFPDGFRVLGQTSQPVDGVRGHSNNTAVLQGFHGATQDFIIVVIFNSQNNNSQNGYIIYSHISQTTIKRQTCNYE